MTDKPPRITNWDTDDTRLAYDRRVAGNRFYFLAFLCLALELGSSFGGWRLGVDLGMAGFVASLLTAMTLRWRAKR